MYVRARQKRCGRELVGVGKKMKPVKPVGADATPTPLLTSSACMYVSVKGSNSAVGTAVRKLR